MSNQTYNRVEKISNHGLEQGIVPRFILQFIGIKYLVFMDKKECEYKFRAYQNVIINDLIPLYDLLEEIKELNTTYIQSAFKGENGSVQDYGVINFDRSLERKIIEKLKLFFINGKILINNWSKCAFFEDNDFDIKKLLFVSDINFNKNKTSQLANNKKFEYLYFIVENARKKFLSEFVTIRNNIEHNDFSISNYQLTVISDVFIVEEPLLGNRKLLDSLNFYFENICEFIELIMIYYFGINSYLNYFGQMKTYERKEYDYTIQKYRFTITPQKLNKNEYDLIIGK